VAEPPLSPHEPPAEGDDDAHRDAEAREARREHAAEAREARRERVQQARETARERVDVAREATRERMELAREAAIAQVERARLTKRRLFGLDRSGPPPEQTRADQPWHVLTIPNAIGFLRLGLIPVFLALALASERGTDALPAVIYAAIAWSDYADGLAARLTGQYSRFGALLDPIVDRLLVIAGVVVCWHFVLLPRWALAALAAREVFMLVAGRYALRRGAALKVNWPGRLAVWPTMSAIFFGLVGLRTTGAVLLYVGLALSLLATAVYGRDAARQVAAVRSPSSST
jgi:cardiolipin synthase